MNTSCFRIGRDEISLAEDIKLLGVHTYIACLLVLEVV